MVVDVVASTAHRMATPFRRCFSSNKRKTNFFVFQIKKNNVIFKSLSGVTFLPHKVLSTKNQNLITGEFLKSKTR